VPPPCLRNCCQPCCDCSFSGCIGKVFHQGMDDIVDLETSNCPSTQLPYDTECEVGADIEDWIAPVSAAPSAGRGGGRSGGGRSAPNTSHSQPTGAHKARGPNWTEAEMLVLIGQKRIEWDGRHNSNQPSLAKFVYGTTHGGWC
jgi:hypothetical protein